MGRLALRADGVSRWLKLVVGCLPRAQFRAQSGRTNRRRCRGLLGDPTDDVDHGRESKLLERVLQPAAERAGLGRVTWHQLRHIHSSLLNDPRVPEKIAQEQLGHASIQTTLNIHTQVVDASHRAAIEQLERQLSQLFPSRRNRTAPASQKTLARAGLLKRLRSQAFDFGQGKASERQPVSEREGMVWGPPPRCALRWATFAWLANRSSRSVGKRERRLEAPPGFEPGVEVLQTSALPLGDGAP